MPLCAKCDCGRVSPSWTGDVMVAQDRDRSEVGVPPIAV